MKNYLPEKFKKATSTMVVFLMLILASFMSVEAQDCSIVIDDPGCPVSQTVCADAVLNNVAGHYLQWEEPQFSLSCSTGTPEDYSFYMEYNLPESQQTCWIFSGVQRVGTNNLRLWQSSGNGEIYFITPKVYIDNDEVINMDLINPNNRNITWRLIVLDENMVEVWSNDYNISGSGDFSITLDPSEITSGNHFLKFQFLGNGNNSIYVDRIYFDAILADAACGGGINFSVTSSHNPGSFFPVGQTTVSYTATYIPVSGNPITETCNFSVTVNEISSASVSKEDATCNLDNGKITILATSSSASPVWKYSLDNGTSWNSFAPGVAITDLPVGTYNIHIKDESTGCTYADVLTATIINAPSVTAPVPVVSVLPEVRGECSVTVDAIPTALDECGKTITGTTTDLLTYSTQGTYTITWNYDDGNGNTASQTQTVVVDDTTAPVPAVAELAEVKGACSISVTAPTANDNCAGTITGTTTDATTYTVPGTYTINWIYSDGNGNSSSQSQTVTVEA
ncbi:MAG TPA: hypothetical protein DCY35_06185, partial [Prolixibacteraceae bacterium]|nr:hypothetical protein [Prolixibacteraceae bacterium]